MAARAPALAAILVLLLAASSHAREPEEAPTLLQPQGLLSQLSAAAAARISRRSARNSPSASTTLELEAAPPAEPQTLLPTPVIATAGRTSASSGVASLPTGPAAVAPRTTSLASPVATAAPAASVPRTAAPLPAPVPAAVAGATLPGAAAAYPALQPPGMFSMPGALPGTLPALPSVSDPMMLAPLGVPLMPPATMPGDGTIGVGGRTIIPGVTPVEGTTQDSSSMGSLAASDPMGGSGLGSLPGTGTLGAGTPGGSSGVMGGGNTGMRDTLRQRRSEMNSAGTATAATALASVVALAASLLL